MSTRKIPQTLFEPLEDIQASDLLGSSSLLNLVKKETPAAIQEAFKNKKTFATVFEINGLGLYLDIPKQYWIPALEQCINFLLEEEKFEDCITLKKLIDDIKKPVRKVNKNIKKKDDGTGINRDPSSDQPNT